MYISTYQSKKIYALFIFLAILDGVLFIGYIKSFDTRYLIAQKTPSRLSYPISLLDFCKKYPANENFISSPRYECYRRALTEGVRRYGLKKISQAFDAYVKSARGTELRGGACHALGHDLGQAALMYGYNNRDILTYCSNICEGGCFNGVGHTYLALGKSITKIDEFCNPQNYLLDSNRVLACYHGFGHGITDTFGIHLEDNLTRCGLIKHDKGRFQCGHAVFMTFSSLPVGVEFSDVPDDLPKFCMHTDPLYQFSCFIFTGYLTYGKTNDPRKAFQACKQIPQVYQKECFERIGESLFIKTPKNPKLVTKHCIQDQSAQSARFCIGGGAKTAVVDANSSPEIGFSICKITPEDIQPYCYQVVGEQIERVRGVEDRRKFCKDFAGIFIDSCIPNH